MAASCSAIVSGFAGALTLGGTRLPLPIGPLRMLEMSVGLIDARRLGLLETVCFFIGRILSCSVVAMRPFYSHTLGLSNGPAGEDRTLTVGYGAILPQTRRMGCPKARLR